MRCRRRKSRRRRCRSNCKCPIPSERGALSPERDGLFFQVAARRGRRRQPFDRSNHSGDLRFVQLRAGIAIRLVPLCDEDDNPCAWCLTEIFYQQALYYQRRYKTLRWFNRPDMLVRDEGEIQSRGRRQDAKVVLGPSGRAVRVRGAALYEVSRHQMAPRLSIP
jgi:hypothetical protein